MDEEERARLEVEDGHTMMIVDTPIVEATEEIGDGYMYSNYPCRGCADRKQYYHDL